VPGPPDGYAVQVDPTDPATIYASGTAGISKSTDDGASWRVIYSSPDGADPLARASLGGAQLAVSPADHNVVYFGHTRGLDVDPTNPDTVWAALAVTSTPDEAGVRVSTDGGESWDFLGRTDIGFVNALVRSADGTTLLAGTPEGIWRYRVSPPPVAASRSGRGR
jgi:hypothetical protein